MTGAPGRNPDWPAAPSGAFQECPAHTPRTRAGARRGCRRPPGMSGKYPPLVAISRREAVGGSLCNRPECLRPAGAQARGALSVLPAVVQARDEQLRRQSFAEFSSADNIRDTFKVMLGRWTMVARTYGAKVRESEGRPPWRAQYRPNHAQTRTRNQSVDRRHVEMDSYKGDIINDIAPTPEARAFPIPRVCCRPTRRPRPR